MRPPYQRFAGAWLVRRCHAQTAASFGFHHWMMGSFLFCWWVIHCLLDAMSSCAMHFWVRAYALRVHDPVYFNVDMLSVLILVRSNRMVRSCRHCLRVPSVLDSILVLQFLLSCVSFVWCVRLLPWMPPPFVCSFYVLFVYIVCVCAWFVVFFH